jgi:carboxypeptidase D
VHGQVKQAGNFAFARIYESGHEVPFYQPLVSLELFHRAIAGLDIATGEVLYTPDYKTVGTPKSTYREGNGTVQFEVLPWDATYNTTTNEPNPGSGSMGSDGKERKRTKRAFKPSYLPKVE